jgi:translation elongation factor EF-G
VLKKALERGIKPMLVVNKIDRPTARPDYVVDKVFDLFCDLGATDEQTDFDICYTSAMKGMSGPSPDTVVDGLVNKKIGREHMHGFSITFFALMHTCRALHMYFKNRS